MAFAPIRDHFLTYVVRRAPDVPPPIGDTVFRLLGPTADREDPGPLDNARRTRDQLQTITEVPVLGLIPRIRVKSTESAVKRLAVHLRRKVKHERAPVPLVGLTPSRSKSELSKSAAAIRRALGQDEVEHRGARPHLDKVDPIETALDPEAQGLLVEAHHGRQVADPDHDMVDSFDMESHGV